VPSPEPDGSRPNIILAMTDDQGWGDVGFNAHPVLKTPHLDAMAESGLRFDRFYAGAPVCSPTRGSCLTGRHPWRYGILFANFGPPDEPSKYPLPMPEVTLAEAVSNLGYECGHFGKWHLGDFEGPMQSAPDQSGFDDWLSTVRKVATVDPEGYWDNGEPVEGPLEGDDSRIIMDRALRFIEGAVAREHPFLAVIWFHTPHLPVLATDEFRALYADHPEQCRHYWGALSAMDAQMGRLRAALREMDVAEDTIVWFCSDNGPEGDEQTDERPGSAGPFRGRKRSLWEGGIRVPAILEWPERIPGPRATDLPCCTSDFYPTLMDVLGYEPPAQPRPIDGISLVDLLDGEMQGRPAPMAFETLEGTTRGSPSTALIGNRHKLLMDPAGEPVLLHDLLEDPAETHDLSADRPDVVEAMMATLQGERASWARSRDGEDYL
jgi:arylsulfatase A-like enzyme